MAEPTDNDLVIATTAGREIVRIQPDGQLIYGPGYTPDEAAAAFWESLARRREDSEARAILAAQLEALLVELGRADLENEIAQMHAVALGGIGQGSGAAVLEAHRTNAALERVVHRAIELGRSLAERSTTPAAPTTPSHQLN